jgi:hypothetical protein
MVTQAIDRHRWNEVADGAVLQEDGTIIAGSAPLRLGTKDLRSFFDGGLTRLRLWNRVLHASEISELYSADLVPKDALVAEFLLNENTGNIAIDTARQNNGIIFNATWATQN